MHALDCNSDCSDDESKDIYAAEFVWPSQAKPFTCSARKPIHKNQQDEKFTFDVSKCERVFLSYIGLDTSRYHILYRCLKN